MTVTIPTVLVVGAGASSSLGYPLGETLIERIVSLKSNRTVIPTIGSIGNAEIHEFCMQLERSGRSSIDSFLESVPRYKEVGKYLIACCLKQYEDPSRLFAEKGDAAWYKILFQSLLQQGRSQTPFEGNQLSIVTFNYDRTIEAYLYHALRNGCDLDDKQTRAEMERIPIVHLHGVLGDFWEHPYINDATPAVLKELSEGIKIIDELENGNTPFCSGDFARAYNLIEVASRVVFLGFGFHIDNVRRLNVDWSRKSQRSVASTFHKISGLQLDRLLARISECGLTRDHFMSFEQYTCQELFTHTLSLN